MSDARKTSSCDGPALGESVVTELGPGVVAELTERYFVVRLATGDQVFAPYDEYRRPTSAAHFTRPRWDCGYGNDQIACMLPKGHLGSHVFKVKMPDARLAMHEIERGGGR